MVLYCITINMHPLLAAALLTVSSLVSKFHHTRYLNAVRHTSLSCTSSFTSSFTSSLVPRHDRTLAHRNKNRWMNVKQHTCIPIDSRKRKRKLSTEPMNTRSLSNLVSYHIEMVKIQKLPQTTEEGTIPNWMYSDESTSQPTTPCAIHCSVALHPSSLYK